MDGHFSRKISIKDQYWVFTHDLDKDISNKTFMFAVGIKLLPEVKRELKRSDWREPLGMVWTDKTQQSHWCSVPSAPLAPELWPELQVQAWLWGPPICNHRVFKESSPTSWASTSGLPSFQDPLAILGPSLICK